MEKLSLATLPLYDQGSLQVLFDKALRDAYLDLEDRAELATARKIKMEISLKPTHVRGDLEEESLDAAIDSALESQ